MLIIQVCAKNLLFHILHCPNKTRTKTENYSLKTIPGTRFMPLYFVRSGGIDLTNSALRGFGRDGIDWSRSAMAYGVGTWAANAYGLKFDPSTVAPSHGPYPRWRGFPVRCLVY